MQPYERKTKLDERRAMLAMLRQREKSSPPSPSREWAAEFWKRISS